jgi:putative hemolysin
MKIDVSDVIRQKNPSLAKWIPGFLLSILKRIIHQDEMNEFLALHGEKTGIPFCEAAIQYFNVKINIYEKSKIPENGRYVFVSNHPLGGFDGIILMKYIHDHFGDVKVPVNDILMNIANIQDLFIPINKHGRQSREAAKAMDEVFLSNIPILTFPAGLCSRKIKGQIVDLEWKKNFIIKTVESKRDIVPIFFEGRNSNFFYNLANLRKKIGIKSNFEMIFLVDELFKHRDKTFNVYFGDIIPCRTFDNSKTYQEWAQEIKNIVYNIPKDFNRI